MENNYLYSFVIVLLGITKNIEKNKSTIEERHSADTPVP